MPTQQEIDDGKYVKSEDGTLVKNESFGAPPEQPTAPVEEPVEEPQAEVDPDPQPEAPAEEAAPEEPKEGE